jgi:hypothetical protein
MFSQVVEGRTNDPTAVRRALDGWVDALPSGHAGWLGATAGVTSDGGFIAVVRFESPEDAQRLSTPEQQQHWWAELRAALDGEAVVTRGERTDIFSPGDPGAAGFVQVVQGRVTDFVEARRQLRVLQELLRVHLPCLLATVTVEHTDCRFTRVLHFRTEEQARAGEAELAPEVRSLDQEVIRLLDGAPAFWDLTEPWFYPGNGSQLGSRRRP